MERTVKQRTNKPKLFRWALWWGLGIIAVCLTILIIKGEKLEGFDGPIMNAIYSMVYRFGILPVVLYIGIIGPVMEEFVFRLWGNGKLWTGITSIILMALFALAVGWWLSLLTIVCGVSILVCFRDDKEKKLFSLMLLSSVVFAVTHAGNYNGEGQEFMLFVSVLHKFGFGLVASYLVINHNLFWSIVLHVANNSILAIPFFIGFKSINNEVRVIENEDFRLEMRTVLVKDNTLNTSKQFQYGATGTYFGNVAVFAHQAMYFDVTGKGINPNYDTLIMALPDYAAFPYCDFNLSFKKEPFNYHRLLNTLVAEGLIEIDTTVTQAYRMHITDQSKLVYGQPGGLMPYNMLIGLIRQDIGLPVFTEIPSDTYRGTTTNAYAGKSVYDSLYVKDIGYSNYRKDYTIDDLRTILDPQGIAIEPTDRKMTVIAIKNNYHPLEELE
jgi:membrane protease YdiL (CAAX protease family)